MHGTTHQHTFYERLGTALTTRCGVAADHLTPTATFEELGLDSMDYVALAMALQKDLGIEIDEEELAPSSTLAEAVTLLVQKTA